MSDISVIIPVYNEEEYVEECVESIFEQETTCNFNVIVCNDASTDSTPEILDRLDGRFERLHVLHNEENIERFRSILKMAEYTDSKYCLKTDGDCLMKEGTIQAIYEELSGGFDIVYGRVDIENTEYLHPAVSQVNRGGDGYIYGGGCIGLRTELITDNGLERIDSNNISGKSRVKYIGPKHKFDDKDVKVEALKDVGVYSYFPTSFRDVAIRKYNPGYIVDGHVDLRDLRGPIYWTVLIGMILIFVYENARDTKEAVELSGRKSFYILYPLYKILAGVLRTIGTYVAAKELIKKIWK